MGCMISVYRFVMGKPEVKSPLGKHGWKSTFNINMHLQIVGFDCGMNSPGLA
jgi:hypothetical protein